LKDGFGNTFEGLNELTAQNNNETTETSSW